MTRQGHKTCFMSNDGLGKMVLLILLVVTIVISKNEFNLTWWRDANIWLNDFFVNAMIFVLTYLYLKKIKNQFGSFVVAYVLSIAIGNFIYLDVTNIKFTWSLLVELVGAMLVLFLSAMLGFKKKGENKRKLEQEEFQVFSFMTNEERSRLYNIKQFIKKHPKECELISKIGIEGVLQLIEKDQMVKKAKRDARSTISK